MKINENISFNQWLDGCLCLPVALFKICLMILLFVPLFAVGLIWIIIFRQKGELFGGWLGDRLAAIRKA
ncbi:MAG: hypothetical protein GY938_31050 [Ketobacter sp.]|nr:hypothetical protein [Ketobacter sp.]